MTCGVHPERETIAYCRQCGRAMCTECKRDVRGMIYCEDCLAQRVEAPPTATAYAAGVPPAAVPSPALALILGFVPGVGAIYNGQFAKAFLHVVIFGLLISVVSSSRVNPFEALFGLLIFIFVVYMAGEAYHTAKKRQLGEPVDEWSGLLGTNTRLQASAGAVLLIVIGVIFLLDTMDLVPLGTLFRYWPVILIAAGVWMLYQKLAAKPRSPDLY